MTIGYRSPLPIALGISLSQTLGYRSPLPIAGGISSGVSAVEAPPIFDGVGGPPRPLRRPYRVGIALGELFILRCEFIPGIATGDAIADGAELFIGNATTPRAIVAVDYEIIAGTAIGERNWSDEEIMILAEAA